MQTKGAIVLFDICDEIVSEDEEIVRAVEVGAIIIVEASDGLWYTGSDVRCDVSELVYKRATSRVTELFEEATMSEEDRIDRAIENEKKSIAYALHESSENNSFIDSQAMRDYTGSQEKYIKDYFEHSFEPAFGSDFRL